MMSAPNTISGRAARTSCAEGDRVVAEVPPLHPLQDHVVAGLQRQVQMRHQPRLAGDRLDQPRVRLDLSRSRRAAAAAGPARPRGSPPRGRRAAAPRRDRRPSSVRSTPVSTTSLKPRSTSRRDLLDHRRRRHAARVPAPVGDDAEGAAVVAAVLHLHVGARPGAEPVDQRRRRPPLGHDVADRDPLLRRVGEPRPGRRAAASRRCRARGRPRASPRRWRARSARRSR